MTQSLAQIFDSMIDKYQPNRVKETMVYYFSLGDLDEEKWTLTVTPDECKIEKGKKTDNADCVLKCSTDYFIKLLFEGYEPNMTDFVAGYIKTSHPANLRRLRIFFE